MLLTIDLDSDKIENGTGVQFRLLAYRLEERKRARYTGLCNEISRRPLREISGQISQRKDYGADVFLQT